VVEVRAEGNVWRERQTGKEAGPFIGPVEYLEVVGFVVRQWSLNKYGEPEELWVSDKQYNSELDQRVSKQVQEMLAKRQRDYEKFLNG